jgi:hypothetical protein
MTTETITGTIAELQKTFPFERVEFGLILRVMERFGTAQAVGKKLGPRKGKPAVVWKAELSPLKALMGEV